jgi:Icc-related predicted phosphoesterase
MTHFAPSRWSIPEAEREDLINGYYASDLEPLIEETKPAVWVHGHLDEASDYRIGETRVVCNPAGYEGRQHKPRLTFDL